MLAVSRFPMERVARTVSFRFAPGVCRVFDCGLGSFLHRANCGRFHYMYVRPAAGEGGWDFDEPLLALGWTCRVDRVRVQYTCMCIQHICTVCFVIVYDE